MKQYFKTINKPMIHILKRFGTSAFFLFAIQLSVLSAHADPCEYPGSAECRDHKRCENFPDFPGCGGGSSDRGIGDGDRDRGGRSESDCIFNPEKRGCHRPGDSYCTFNPDKPGCRQPGDSYCTFNPDKPGCHKPGDSYCTFNPDKPGCRQPGDSYCTFNPDKPGCRQPGDSYCTFNPEKPGCHKPGDSYCTFNPDKPGCRSRGPGRERDWEHREEDRRGGGRRPPKAGSDPTYCVRNPHAPFCVDPIGHCRRNPSSVHCK